MKKYSTSSGMTIVEITIAAALAMIVTLAAVTLIRQNTMALVASRDRSNGEEIAQMTLSRLKSVPFQMIFAIDSSSAEYGLSGSFTQQVVGGVAITTNTYPYLAVLDQIKSSAEQAGFSRFTTQITYLRRDSSDDNGNGLTSDLIPFKDANADGCDDYDPQVCWKDINSDGDFYDQFISTVPGPYKGQILTETPSTNLKQVTVKVWKRNKLVTQQVALFNLGQLTGAPNTSNERLLSLLISTPPPSAVLYRYTGGMQPSHDLLITKPYPADVQFFRADTASPLVISGRTAPQATITILVNNQAGTTVIAATDGTFSIQSSAVQSLLVEGLNAMTLWAEKAGLSSPLTQRNMILDVNKPNNIDKKPAFVTHDLTPYVGSQLQDTGVATACVSGICPDVITLKVKGMTATNNYTTFTTVDFVFDEQSHVRWVDPVTHQTPKLIDGQAYQMFLEFGDKAGYKATDNWNFVVHLSTDSTPPVIDNWFPTGVVGSQTTISARVTDPETGIDPSSILMTVNGNSVAAVYDAYNGSVSFSPSVALLPGTVNVSVQASNWATPTPLSSTKIWSFVVN